MGWVVGGGWGGGGGSPWGGGLRGVVGQGPSCCAPPQAALFQRAKRRRLPGRALWVPPTINGEPAGWVCPCALRHHGSAQRALLLLLCREGRSEQRGGAPCPSLAHTAAATCLVNMVSFKSRLCSSKTWQGASAAAAARPPVLSSRSPTVCRSPNCSKESIVTGYTVTPTLVLFCCGSRNSASAPALPTCGGRRPSADAEDG